MRALALRPRLTPVLFHVLSSLLLLLARPSPSTSFVQPLLATLSACLTTLVLTALKTWWIPNPKDDVLAPSTLHARVRRHAPLAAAWLLLSAVKSLHLYSLGPLVWVTLRCIVLPLAYVLPWTRHSCLFPVWRWQRASWVVTALSLGMLLLSLSLPAHLSTSASTEITSPLYVELTTILWDHALLILFSLVAMVVEVLSWRHMHSMMLDYELDPWVLATDTISIASMMALLLFAIFELPAFISAFSWSNLLLYAPYMARTSILTSLWLLSTCFLIQHLTPVALAVLALFRDLGFCAFWYILIGNNSSTTNTELQYRFSWALGLPATILLGFALYQMHQSGKPPRIANQDSDTNTRNRFRFRNHRLDSDATDLVPISSNNNYEGIDSHDTSLNITQDHLMPLDRQHNLDTNSQNIDYLNTAQEHLASIDVHDRRNRTAKDVINSIPHIGSQHQYAAIDTYEDNTINKGASSSINR